MAGAVQVSAQVVTQDRVHVGAALVCEALATRPRHQGEVPRMAKKKGKKGKKGKKKK
jgi:hypothetical protein